MACSTLAGRAAVDGSDGVRSHRDHPGQGSDDLPLNMVVNQSSDLGPELGVGDASPSSDCMVLRTITSDCAVVRWTRKHAVPQNTVPRRDVKWNRMPTFSEKDAELPRVEVALPLSEPFAAILECFRETCASFF